jgi:hypothetical protein
LQLVGAEAPVTARHDTVTPAMVFVKIPKKDLVKAQEPIRFRVTATRANGQVIRSERDSIFIGPGR